MQDHNQQSNCKAASQTFLRFISQERSLLYNYTAWSFEKAMKHKKSLPQMLLPFPSCALYLAKGMEMVMRRVAWSATEKDFHLS